MAGFGMSLAITSLVGTVLAAFLYLGMGSIVLLTIRKNPLLFIIIIGSIVFLFLLKNWRRV